MQMRRGSVPTPSFLELRCPKALPCYKSSMNHRGFSIRLGKVEWRGMVFGYNMGTILTIDRTIFEMCLGVV